MLKFVGKLVTFGTFHSYLELFIEQLWIVFRRKFSEFSCIYSYKGWICNWLKLILFKVWHPRGLFLHKSRVKIGILWTYKKIKMFWDFWKNGIWPQKIIEVWSQISENSSEYCNLKNRIPQFPSSNTIFILINKWKF